MTETVAQLPDNVYYVLGFIVISNLGVIITCVGAAIKLVYRFAVLETKVTALHRRQDFIENKRYSADNDEDTN